MSDQLATLTEEIEKKDLIEILALLQFTAIQIGEKAPILLESVGTQTETFKELSGNIENFSKNLNVKIENIWTGLDSVNAALKEQSLKIKNSSMIKVDKEDYESLISIMESLMTEISALKKNTVVGSGKHHKSTEAKTLLSTLSNIKENTERLLNARSSEEIVIEASSVPSIPEEVLPKRKHRPKTTNIQIELFDKDKGTIAMLAIASGVSFLVGAGVCAILLNIGL